MPARDRSAFIRQLLELALPPPDDDNDPLYRAACEVERDAALSAKMAEWEAATIQDGLHELPSKRRRR